MNTPTLSELTTMHIGGRIAHYMVVDSKHAVERAVALAKHLDIGHFVLGSGSNVIATDNGYDGLIIKNELLGFDIIHEDDISVTIKIGAGENWDTIVERTVDMSLSGIEAMSAIPGTVGATPVQNVGAYGQEIADTLVSLEAYDTKSKQWVILSAKECGFGYRTSHFKNPETRHHIIASATLRLSKAPMQPPFYAALAQYLSSHDIADSSPAAIRSAVINIRRTKLPDPRKTPNTGSFFKNPIVDHHTSSRLLSKYPHMPTFPTDNEHVKLAAGWLIEQAGLRGYAAYGFKTYEHNALVVVNSGSTHYADLAAFKNHIIETVKNTFGVTLEQEPELLINTQQ